MPGDPHGLLALQRSIGNRAVAAQLHGHDGEHDPRAQRAAIDRGLRSPGRPLGGATLAKKESQFQADLSGVRLHTGPAAAEAAAAVEAHAFTVDQDIVLGERGDDSETLDHELTHVLRNQQGATAGHDTGGGFSMTRPNDRGEREAASNAARMRSGGPSAVVGGVPSIARAPAAPAPATIQRWAFADGQQVPPDAAGLTQEMKKIAEDELVHDYQTRDGISAINEFKAHAERKTDYLGNLPGPASKGVWVRFEKNGINVIGEDHTGIRLDHILTAVESASFVYEPFVVENLESNEDEKNTWRAYPKELSTVFGRFGMDEDSDWKAHGAESLYPKLGHSMAQLLPYMKGEEDIDMLRKEGPREHLGQSLQRYLKIAWQYGKDMRDNSRVQQQNPKREKLVEEYTNVKHPTTSRMDKFSDLFSISTVNDFVTNLPHDGHIGDAFTPAAMKKYAKPLARYLEALIDEMRERGESDNIAKTSDPMGVPKGQKSTWKEKEGELEQRRNTHFRAAVENAEKKGIRYAGMGLDHLTALINRGEMTWPAFKMASKNLGQAESEIDQRRTLAEFENSTTRRENQARG